jgi:hypothetical protein
MAGVSMELKAAAFDVPIGSGAEERIRNRRAIRNFLMVWASGS